MAPPVTESTYGAPPYHESALKAALRMLAANAGASFQGLSAVRPGSNFGDAFLQAAGASSRASSAAHQAAQVYAMKQQEAIDKQRHEAISEKFMMAQAEGKHKPTPPTKDEEAVRILGRPLTETEKAKLAGVYIAPPKIAGGKVSAPKPQKARGVKEQRVIDAVNLANPNDPAHRDKLNQWLGTQTDPMVRDAILKKLLGNMRVRTP